MAAVPDIEKALAACEYVELLIPKPPMSDSTFSIAKVNVVERE
jgi:hypothetical protein